MIRVLLPKFAARSWAKVLLAGWLLAGLVHPRPTPAQETPPPVAKTERIEAKGLHNVFRVDERLYSGGSPEGDEGFRSLQKLGVRTILSVDGAKPEVDRAAKFGLRYVHIPVGYAGIPRADALRLAKVVRDLPGPVYLHCHHGKHRGPAAAAVVLLCLDVQCKASDAVAIMKRAGTDPRYSGLFAAVEKLSRPTSRELDRAPANFPPVAKVAALAEKMVEVDAANDRLKEAQKAGWVQSPAHPDLDPPHEAIQLLEHYQEAARLPDAMKRSSDFRRLLAQAANEVQSLEARLRERPIDVSRSSADFKRIADSCVHCHARFRDRIAD